MWYLRGTLACIPCHIQAVITYLICIRYHSPSHHSSFIIMLMCHLLHTTYSCLQSCVLYPCIFQNDFHSFSNSTIILTKTKQLPHIPVLIHTPSYKKMSENILTSRFSICLSLSYPSHSTIRWYILSSTCTLHTLHSLWFFTFYL